MRLEVREEHTANTMTSDFVSSLSKWFDEGLRRGATHMLIIYDDFSYLDPSYWPVYVMPGEPIQRRIDEERRKNMQRVTDVFDFRLPKDSQLIGIGNIWNDAPYEQGAAKLGKESWLRKLKKKLRGE